MKKKKSEKSVDSADPFIKIGSMVRPSKSFFVPRTLLWGEMLVNTAPSDRLNIAAIGAGGKRLPVIFGNAR